MQHFFSDEGGTNGSRDYVPSINVAENDQGYEVSVDLPGIKPEDVSVELHENQLTIAGKREAEKEETGKTYHRIERRYGEFRRVISLPAAVDDGKISADFHQGVLRISLPKSEKVKPTRITIKA
jgi:HSP20 family protein